VTPTWRRTFSSRRGRSRAREGELAPRHASTCARATQWRDASNLFDKSFKREDLVECGCNMHARPLFREGVWMEATHARRCPSPATRSCTRSGPKSATKTRTPSGRRDRRGSKEVFGTTSSHGCLGLSGRTSHILGAGKSDFQYALNHREALARFPEHERFRSTTGTWSGCTCARHHPKELSLRGVGRRAARRAARRHSAHPWPALPP